jgi:hypothetical protein
MLNPDEIIDTGVASLKSELPTRSPSAMAAKACRQASRKSAILRMLVGAGVCIAVGGVITVAMRPTSAAAALRESASLSEAQPVIHIHLDRQDSVRNSESAPWPRIPVTDIWRFRDHYVRASGHTLYVAYRDGRTFGYDDRFSQGFQSSYDAGKDKFWTFDGTIGVELAGAHRNPPTVQNTVLHGVRFKDFRWLDTDAMRHQTTADVYVDPESKLVRRAESVTVSENGDTSHSSTVVEYPTAIDAQRRAPHFPGKLKFWTRGELQAHFDKEIILPDQSKTVGGIRTSLYGVVIYPNVPDGLGVDVITRGGAGPDFGSGHQPEILGAQLLGTKRSAWLPPMSDPSHVRYGRHAVLRGGSYIVNQSDDLLARAPSRITIRVPVWKLGPATTSPDGKPGRRHDFVGYVTFTTSKLFTSIGDGSWSFYGSNGVGD